MVRKNYGQRDPGESGAGPDIENLTRIRKPAPRNYGIQNVLDGSLAFVEYARQVELTIGFDDQFEMPRSFRDESLTMGNIDRKKLSELAGEGHCPSSFHGLGNHRVRTAPIRDHFEALVDVLDVVGGRL